ncbi:hypothetical protein M0Q28_05155 [Patescibacteria group bacterium]|nr:hypothetical protein [Patescibacteria group bacterium]
MQNREIVRYLIAGLICAVGLVLLGFGPLLMAKEDVWAASTDSRMAMPIGESKPMEAVAPFEMKSPGYGGAEFIKKQFGR